MARRLAEVGVRERGRVQHAGDHGGHAAEHGGLRALGERERALGVEARVVGHDQRRAGAQRVQAHLPRALGDRRERQHAVLGAELQPAREALEGQLLEARGQRGELRAAGGPGGQRDLDDAVGVGLGERAVVGLAVGVELVVLADHELRAGALDRVLGLEPPEADRQRQQRGADGGHGDLERDVAPHVRQRDGDDVAGSTPRSRRSAASERTARKSASKLSSSPSSWTASASPRTAAFARR